MSPSKNGPRSPERIVLLNHMMKPIIYSSSQFWYLFLYPFRCYLVIIIFRIM